MKTKDSFKILIICILFLFSIKSIGQITTFQKIFGSSGQDGCYSVVQTDDSGYVFTGYWTVGGSLGTNYMCLIKTSSTGELIWTQMFDEGTGIAPRSMGYSVVQTTDKGFAVAGFDDIGEGPLNPQFYLVKTNSNGIPLWRKTFGGYYIEEAHSIKQTSDGGFIIAGYTDSTAGFVGHLLLIKTNLMGDSLWGKTFGFGDIRYGDTHSVIQTDDGGYALLGYFQELNNSGIYDIYLYKTNSVGTLQWSKKFGGNNDDVGYCIQNTQNNGFIIAGSTMSFGNGGYDIYIIKTNNNGDTLWTKTYGGFDNEWGNYISPTLDNGYIIIGSTENFSVGSYDVFLVKIDSIGNQQWSKTFGGINADYGYCVQQTFDGGYIIVGMRGDNIYLIKTDENGNLTNTNEIIIPISCNVFPNPTNQFFTIQIPTQLHNISINLYNLTGEDMTLLTVITSSNETNFLNKTIDASKLNSGIYFLKITSDNFSIIKKVELLK